MKKIEMPFIDHDAPIIDAENLDPGHKKMFPVLLFSHGLAAHANCYISILSEIASNGFENYFFLQTFLCFLIKNFKAL